MIHGFGSVRAAGESPDRAHAAMIMLHGRGATAESILELAPLLASPGFTYIAPQAPGNSWYPHSFLAPIAANEPGISTALAGIEMLLEDLATAGIPAERTLLLGFSQGACLALEFAARHSRHNARLGGVIGLSGGVIGPDDTPRDLTGSLGGTPVLLGCGDADFHIPRERVEASAELFQKLGAVVDLRLYPDMGHTVNEDELDAVRAMMRAV